MSKDPGANHDVEQLVALAKRYSDRERHGEAAELFSIALRLDPTNLAIKLGLAHVRRLQREQPGEQPRSLRDVLREEMRRSSIDAAHFLGLAHIYAEKGENVRAVECLEIAKAKDLANPALHKLHGRILQRRKDYDGAAEEMGKALRYSPFDREVAESLGRVEYERKRFEPALAATVHAFLLLNDADEEGAERLKRRMRTLKQILHWENRDLVALFRTKQEELHVAFDRLEWHRERFLEEEAVIKGGVLFGSVPRKQVGGQLDLAVRLRRLNLWSNLSDEQIFQLTRAIQEEIHDGGSLVFASGSSGRDLYILERGEISIERPTPYGTFRLGTLAPGDLFGEVNFLSNYERSADALATQPAQLLRVDAEELERLLDAAPELAVQLYWSFWHALARKLRGTNEQLKSFFSPETLPENFVRLRRHPPAVLGRVQVDSSDKIRLFREQGLSRSELITLATFSRECRFAEGSPLFHEGDQGTEMYVILEGRALVSKFIPGAGEEALAILGRGDFFGEMSLIDGEPRSADAKAYGGPLTVLALDQATVREVLSMDAHASLEFLQLLCRLITNRLREIDEKVVGWRILSGGGQDESRSA